MKIVTILALSLFFLMGLSKIGDYDIWYHIKVGQYILETGKIKHLVDPFSFTSDNPLATQAWLADVLFYKVYSLSGIEGLIILKASVIFLLFFVLYKTMVATSSKGFWNVYLFFIVLIVVAFSMRTRMFVRPHIIGFLCFGLFLYILNLYKHKGKNYLYLLPLIQVFWINFHASSILGLALPSIFLLGEGLQNIINRTGALKRKQLYTLGIATLSVVVVSFINPRGYDAVIFPFVMTGQNIYMANIEEWQPLTMELLFGYGLRYTWGFSLLLISGLLVLASQGRRIDITDLLIFFIFLFLAFKRVRFVAEFAIIAGPIVARGLLQLISQSRLEGLRRFQPIANMVFSIAIVLIFYFTILNSSTYAFGLGVKERVFPEKAVDFIEENRIGGNMFNSLAYGGYLIFRHFPEKKVFIDGRNNVYDKKLYQDYLDARHSKDVWQKLVDRYGINYVILEYARDYSKKEMIPHLIDNPEWVLIYWDRVAMVYLRDQPENNSIIEKFGYRYIRPNDFDFTYLNRYVLHEKEKIPDIKRELERSLEFSPDNEEVHLALAYLYHHMGLKDKTIDEIKLGIDINPNLDFAFAALGRLLLEKGDIKGAEEAFKRTLKIDPKNETALLGMRKIKGQ